MSAADPTLPLQADDQALYRLITAYQEGLGFDQPTPSLAHLTPEQRNQARQEYKTIKQLPPDQRQQVQQKWEEHQQLPPEKRRELASRGGAPPQPSGATPKPSGAPPHPSAPSPKPSGPSPIKP